jgi:nucleoside-diphosphate-sugar epimerase
MAYLVTGGKGFIGCYVVKQLLDKGEDVVSYDLGLGPSIVDWILTEEEQKRVKWVGGDITDALNLLNVCKQNSVQKIVHLASFQIPAANANPALAVQNICGGTVNTFEAARILGLKRVIWASSIAIFGPEEAYRKAGVLNAETIEKGLPNDARQISTSVYGASKTYCEFMAKYYHDTYGVESIAFRFSAVYGLGRLVGKSSFTTTMIEAAALGKPYLVPCSDDTVDWQYVEDIARLIVLALDAPMPKTLAFNTKGDVRPVMEGVKYLQALAPEAKFTFEGGKFGVFWRLDTSVLEAELGFKPEYNLEKGILKTFNQFRRMHGLPEVKGK